MRLHDWVVDSTNLAGEILCKVDEKAMIRNQYNRIPHLHRTPNRKGTHTIKMA